MVIDGVCVLCFLSKKSGAIFKRFVRVLHASIYHFIIPLNKVFIPLGHGLCLLFKSTTLTEQMCLYCPLFHAEKVIAEAVETLRVGQAVLYAANGNQQVAVVAGERVAVPFGFSLYPMTRCYYLTYC